MLPNSEIYGTRENWIPYSTSNKRFYKPEFDSWYNGVQTGKLKFNEKFDSSIIFVGVNNPECDLLHYTIFENTDTDSTSDESIDILYRGKKEVDGIFYTFVPTNNNYVSGEKSTNDKSWGYDISSINTQFQNVYNVLAFDYNNTIFLIMVHMIKKSEGTGKAYKMTLADYIKNYNDLENYPITGYHVRTYLPSTNAVKKRERMSISSDTPDFNIQMYNEYYFNGEPFLYYTNNTSIAGKRQINTTTDGTQFEEIYRYIGNPDTWKYVKIGKQIVSIYTGTIENIYKQVAFLGFWFTDNVTTAEMSEIGEKCVDKNAYCPVITESGYTTGEYFAGEETRKLPNVLWGDNPYENTGFTELNKDNYNLNTQFANPTVDGLNSFATYYLIDNNDVKTLSLYLYDVAKNLTLEVAQEELLQKYLTTNPIDCIISLKMFPFDLKKYLTPLAPLTQPITLGNQIVSYSVGGVTSITSAYVVGGVMSGNRRYIIDMGSCSVKRKYNNFLDLEPYTTAELFIPFCGSVAIPMSNFVGHTLGVKYIIDFVTGSCIACVMRDNLCVDSINGNIAVDIPVSGIQQADYQNALYRANANVKQSALGVYSGLADSFGTVGRAVSGDIGGALTSLTSGFINTESALISHESAQYDLKHTPVPYKTVGGSSPLTGFINEQSCRLIIHRPKFLNGYNIDNLATYAHTTGFACIVNAPLSEFKGLTVCSSIDISGITATDTELSMLKDILSNGVYL